MTYKAPPTLIILLSVSLPPIPGIDPDDEVRRIVPTWDPPCFVAKYDPHVGISSLICTRNPRLALKLSNHAAYDLWLSSPDDDPTLPNGKPNRPLRAFNVEFSTRPDCGRNDQWFN